MLQKPIKKRLQAEQCEHTSTPERFPSGSSTQWCDNKTCGRIFLGFYLPYIDAPDFWKFISSSGTATETTEMQERDSSRCLQRYTKSFASRPSFLIQPELAAVRNHCQLTAVWWPTQSDLASSSCWTDVRSIESVSRAGMCFVFRGWKMWVYFNRSYFGLGRLNRIPEFRQSRTQHVQN